MAQLMSNLGKKHTRRKPPTVVIRLGFLIKDFFCKIIFSGLLSGFPYQFLYFCLLSLTPTVSVTNVVTPTEIFPSTPFNVDVYGFQCKNLPVNATLERQTQH